MPKVELSSGLNVHYEQVGSGPDVVMIHGIGGNLAIWHLRIVPMLWERMHILTYDLRGHGYTDITDVGYSPTQQAADLKELLDSLGVQKVDLVGHSYGADIALYFAYLYPERVNRMVLVEAIVPALVPTLVREQLWQDDWAASVLEKMGVPVPEDRRLDTEYMLNEAMKLPTKWGPLKDMPSQWTTDHMIKLYSHTSVLRDALDIGELTTDNIPAIKAPTLLIYDTGSVLWHQSFEFLRDHLPNAAWALLETTDTEIAHFAPLEKPDVVADRIANFLLAPVPPRGQVT